MKLLSVVSCVLILISFGCKKNKISPLKDKNIIIISGNSQTGFFNEPLKDSIVVQVTDAAGNPLMGERVRYLFLHERVNGGVRFSTKTGALTDRDGFVFGEWTAACYEKKQSVMVYVADSSSNIIDSVIFEAEVGDPVGWANSCGIYGERGNCTESDRRILAGHDGVYYTTCVDKIYRSQDGGKEWEEMPNSPEVMYYSSMFDIEFSKEGWMYLVTTESGIHLSKNHFDWENIGQINRHYTGNLLVGFLREDTFLYASYMQEGLKRSADNGQSWKNLPIHTHSIEIYRFINRHPNGDLYLFDQHNILWRSKDSGDSWQAINLDDKYVHTRVTDFIIGEDGLLYIGSLDASLAILSADTYQGELRKFYLPSTEEQYVNNLHMIDGILYFNVAGNANFGIHSSENWERLEIGFDKPVFSYLLKEDGNFLIGSGRGVYGFF